MKSIITYNNTKHELEIEREHLEMLLEKKEQMYSKVMKITSSQNQNAGSGCKLTPKDKMALFMIEYMKKNPKTGKSLNEEIEESKETVRTLEKHLNIITSHLCQLNGIEYELYSQIKVKNRKPTQAVEKVAELYYDTVSLRTVWNIYNDKIKKIINLQ